jgi:hypothetical protein
MQSDVTLMIQPVAVTAHQLRNDELGSTPATGAGDRKEGRKRGQETKATGQNIPRSPRINYALVSDSMFLIEGVQSAEAHDDLLLETM